MADFKDRIRGRLAEISASDEDFDELANLVDRELDTVSGGFVSFLEFLLFSQAPGEPGAPNPGNWPPPMWPPDTPQLPPGE